MYGLENSPVEDDVYPSRDMKLIITIMALGHRPLAIRRENGTLWFDFDLSAMEDIQAYLRGDDLELKSNALWTAWGVFRTNLSNL